MVAVVRGERSPSSSRARAASTARTPANARRTAGREAKGSARAWPWRSGPW